MDKDINKNLTPEQAQGIEKQDVTKGVVDVDILEQSPSQIPEQQPSGTLASTLANAETVNEQAQEDRTKRELAEAERIKRQEKVNEQELLTRTLGQETLGQGEAEQEAIANSSIGTAQAQIDSLDQAILASSKALKAAEVQDALDVKKISTNSRGVPASIVRGQQAILAAERRAERNLDAIELENDIATSALLQGKVDNAQKAIERAIKLKFDDKKAELTLEKEWLARSDRDLSEAKANELREVEKEEAEAQSVFDIAAQARQAGAGQKEINAILNAKNRDEALSNAGSLGSLARLDIAYKNAQINSLRSKNIAEGMPVQNVEQVQQKVKFVQDTIQNALEVANAAGRSGGRRAVERLLVGSTDFTRLEAFTDTIKTNVLAMVGDPDVKKFFGPQMTEADVRMMTSVETALNAENLSPQDITTELKRLDAVFEKLDPQYEVKQAFFDTLVGQETENSLYGNYNTN